jgi:purine-binding chemotaxis protein CheW
MTASLMSPEAARELLERRARALARRPPEIAQDAMIEVVEFQIGGERYAIESRQILAVFTLTDLVPIPGAVAPLAGITVWRGNVISLLDVRAALGLSSTALNDLRFVIVVGEARSCAGILVDALQGIATRRAAEFGAPTQERSRYGRGLSTDAIMLIDGANLARQHGSGGRLE